MGVRLREPPETDGRAPWFVPPRLRTAEDPAAERHASWLELFFDLVFVVAITELSRLLVLDHSAGGFLRFAALFVPVFVAWQGYMAYATRFDTDDLGFRLAYFAAMLAIAAMAVLIDDVAHGVHTAAFAVAYVALRSFMLALYGRAWIAVPEARPLIRFYGGGYGIGAAIWLASLAVDTPYRYWLWGFAQLIERAGADHLGTGPSVALLGGVVLFVLSLIVTRTVVVGGRHWRGVSLKLGATAIIVGLLAAETALPPVAVAAVLALVLAAVVAADRALMRSWQAAGSAVP